jgi:PAS domain S-box-containing protein
MIILILLGSLLPHPLAAGPATAPKAVLVGITRDFPPYEYLNAKGEPDGYDVDVIKAAAAVMGLPLTFKAAPWDTIHADLEAGRIDTAPGVLFSPERAARLDFCAPHLVVHYSIFVRTGSPSLSSLEALRGRRVLVERGSQMAEFLAAQGLDSSVVPVESEPAALRTLASGAQDAAIVPLLLGLGMIQEFHLDNLKAVGGSVYARELCFALPRGREQIKTALATGLAIINRTNQYDAIYRKWFGHLEPAAPNAGHLLRLASWTALAVLALLLGTLVWSGSLKRQVRQRTGELHRANRAIQENAQLLEAIVDTLPLALFAKDPADGYRFVLWNNQCEAIFGLDRQLVLGKVDGDLWPAEQAAFFRQVDLDVIAQGTVVDVAEEPLESRSRGPILLHTIKTAVHDSQGRPRLVLGLSEDITERKRLEAERRSLEVRLQETQKLESLGSLAGGVAHDMNNVLGSILGLVTAFQDQADQGTPLARALETITKACVRGGTMVRGLLAFARRSLTEERELDLNGLVRDEVQLLTHTTLARVRLEMDLAEDLQPIRGDASALTHALMNLCVNAVDAMAAMAETGALTLRTRNAEPGWVEIVVQDTGGGMPPEVIAKVLDPFFTTKSHGTGLGLSIVHATVKAHLGQMQVESQVGQGTRVTLRFPACTPGRTAVESRPLAGPAAHRPLEILLVDDDELIQESLESVLNALGHASTTASSGEEALASLDAGLQPDLMILDMNMPGLGGAGSLPFIRALWPRLPILLSTGRVDQAALDLTLEYEGVTLLAKPFTMKELQEMLGKVIP